MWRNSPWSSKRFEAKRLDLRKECEILYPDREWTELTAKEQVEVIRSALQPDSFLINPHSDYMKYWDLVLAVALLFTSIVTPFEVIFTTRVSPWSTNFWVNRFVDLIFIKDMFMQFFLKVEVSVCKNDTVLITNPSDIRCRYVKSWFFIDLVSVLPFDLLLALYQGSSALTKVKTFRLARLLRLFKMARVLRSSRVVVRWQTYWSISFGLQKLAKFACLVMLCAHWMACAWGLAAAMIGEPICDSDGNRLDLDGPLPLKARTWLTQLFLESKVSPDNPCNPWHVYTAALYWSVMTITSIGYGDIYPTRNEEYMVGTACMLLGGVLWAYTIGSVCGVMANADPVNTSFEASMDLLNVMMKDAEVPMPKLYRAYLREAKDYNRRVHFRAIASEFSPKLQGLLYEHVSSATVLSVWYLRTAPAACATQLMHSMLLRFYPKRERVLDMRDLLCFVERGTLARSGQIIGPGGAFQIDFIVNNPRFRKREVGETMTSCIIMGLGRDRFYEIVEKYPELLHAVNRAAMLFALTRFMHMCSEKRNMATRSRNHSQSSKGWVAIMHSLRDVKQHREVSNWDNRSSMTEMNSATSYFTIPMLPMSHNDMEDLSSSVSGCAHDATAAPPGGAWPSDDALLAPFADGPPNAWRPASLTGDEQPMICESSSIGMRASTMKSARSKARSKTGVRFAGAFAALRSESSKSRQEEPDCGQNSPGSVHHEHSFASGAGGGSPFGMSDCCQVYSCVEAPAHSVAMTFAPPAVGRPSGCSSTQSDEWRSPRRSSVRGASAVRAHGGRECSSGQRLDALEQAWLMSVAETQAQLDAMRGQLEELRHLRTQLTEDQRCASCHERRLFEECI